MDQGKIFISSILNREIENLQEERNTVRKVVESYRFLKPWAFEKGPASTAALAESYLREVEDCDLFISSCSVSEEESITKHAL